MSNSKDDKRPTMAQRDARLREVLRQRGEASIGEMASALGVSEMTLRRDLDRLERDGHVRRTHGGAVPAERLGFEFDFVARRQSNQRAKRAIAAEAFKLVKPGDRLLLDAGTTTLELACLLRRIPDLTVVTPSLAVASELQFSDGVQTILLGGVLRRGSPDLTGEVTEAVLDMLAVDTAFQGADGIGLDGTLYTADLGVARVDQKIRRRAARTYVLADSSKVGRTALACHGKLQEMAGWITDDGIAPEHLAALRALGVPITVV
jgi:DeoR/GlpR family transcriptional regulator of sugar metabolism